MNYDVFISYARKDDVDARVSAFVDALSRFHKVITGDDLRVFFDRDEIRSGDDWYLRLLESLRSSASMVALLSPAYLESEYCWIEWTTFERQAAVAMAVDQGIKPLVVVPQPGLETALDTVNPTWLVGRTPWRSLLDPLQRGTVDLTAGRNVDDLLNRLTEESIRRRLADLTDRLDAEDGFTGELVESVRWIRRLRLRRDKAKASAAHRMPTLRPGFVGRVPELRAMRRALAEGTEVAVSAEGVGGIGKTEIAVAYAHAFAWDYPGGRWFIPAEGATNLAPLLANALAEGLGVILTPEQLADSDGGFRYIVSRLRTLPDDARKVLVVLDNVNQDALVSAEAVRSLGVDAEWFDLIITSRKRLRGGASDGTLRMVRIDVLPERELLTLLGLPPDAPETERAAAAILLERTGRLTLAVEIAGAYCRRNSVALSDYVADLEDVLEGLSDSLNAGAATEINHSGKYVDHLFRLSIESLSPPAKMILGYACRMHPDHVVIPWLSELCCREDSTLAKRKLGKTGFEKALLELQNASLMEAPDASGRICRMHRLLGDTVRGIFELNTVTSPQIPSKLSIGESDSGQISDSRSNLVTRLVEEFLKLRWWDKRLHWQLESIAPFLSTLEDSLLTATLCTRASSKLSRGLSQFNSAEILIQRALEIRERLLGRDHAETLQCVHSLAILLRNKGDYQQAKDLYVKMYQAHMCLDGTNCRTTHLSACNLAGCLAMLGDVRRAIDLYESALEFFNNNLGQSHRYTLETSARLADLREDIGTCDFSAALLPRQRLMNWSEMRFGPDHPGTLKHAHNVAIQLLKSGKFFESERLIHQVIDARERILGPDHPDTISSLNTMANLLFDKGDLAGAEPLYRRALEVRERTFGPEHPVTLGSVNNLANLLSEKGDLAGAEPLYRRALEVRERTFGPEHPVTLGSVNNLANLLSEMGDLAGAEPLYRRTLEARERLLGPEHPDTLSSVNNLAILLREKGDLVGAEPLQRRALEARERILGPVHPRTLRSVIRMANLLNAKGDLAGAERLYRRALEARERTLGHDHPDTKESVVALKRLLETRRIVESIKGRMECERCLGTGFVAHADIVRLGMQAEWRPGPCMLCREATGIDDKS